MKTLIIHSPKKILPLAAMLFFSFSCTNKNPRIVFHTCFGEIRAELFQDQAPLTVKNFLHFTENKRFNPSDFYRVVTMNNQPTNSVKIEVVQGGLQFRENIDTIKGIPHETTFKTGLRHVDGTLSMARDKPGSASTEFFICIGDQPSLDFGGKRNPDGQGFAAFGKIMAGMDLIRKIQSMQADSNQLLIKKVTIDSISILY
jgi:peptidyl-prolyl cis-trans isomerase A (cyclophilin A)